MRERLFGDLKKRLVAAPFERGLLDGKLKGVKLCKEGNEPVDDLVEVGVFVKQDAVQRMMALQLGRLGLENEAVVSKSCFFSFGSTFGVQTYSVSGSRISVGEVRICTPVKAKSPSVSNSCAPYSVRVSRISCKDNFIQNPPHFHFSVPGTGADC